MTRRLLPLLLLPLLGAGCDLKQYFQDKTKELTQKATEAAVQQGIKTGTGQDVDVNVDQGGLSFTDPKTGRSFAVGENVTLPENFPKDVPLYPGATPTSVSVTEAGKGVALLLIVKEQRDTVRDWYKTEAEAKGWTKAGVFETGDTVMLSFTRQEDGRTAKLTVTFPPKTLQETVNVMIARNPGK